MSPRRSYLFAFLGTVVAGLLFILLTDHRWEDWYITFRASKNLAIGNGLTFTAGERVYSYTSPINTLLPALFAWLGRGGNMDEVALLGYRLCCLAALGTASVLLLRIARRLAFDAFHQAVLLLLFVGNLLILDFSINGMEAAFMMLFLVLLADGLEQGASARPGQLVCAFAGLMYTRPDWFVYAGPLVLFHGVFTLRSQPSGAWKPMLRTLVLALCLGAVLYLPWIIATWLYYGSPVPNTILAKANLIHYSSWELLKHLVLLPYELLSGDTCAERVFMPAYYGLGGWHGIEYVSWGISLVCLSAVFWPRVPPLGRALSLSAAVAIYYLSYVSGQGGMPWYLPNVGVQLILAFVCLSQCVARRWHRGWARAGSVFVLAFSLLVLVFGTIQIRTQQQVIEHGTRRDIGLWLRDHSKPGDSVLMECLGYIGFYSQLKTYDYPGMSSKEVVAFLRGFRGASSPPYAELIRAFEPEFLVLRPFEFHLLRRTAPGLLETRYQPVMLFDSEERIPKAWYVWGRGYLEYDSKFMVMRKRPAEQPVPVPTPAGPR